MLCLGGVGSCGQARESRGLKPGESGGLDVRAEARTYLRSKSKSYSATETLEGLVVEGGGVGAGEAEALAVAVDEAVEVDAFVAAVAGDAGAFEAGEFAGGEGDADPGFGEEVVVGEVAVGFHLLRIFVEVGVEVAGEGFGGLEGYDAEGFVGVRFELGVEVDEGGGHFAEVAELEGSLADAAAGDYADGVGCTAIDFYEGDEALAVGVEGAVGEGAGAGVVDVEAVEGEHGHADA